MCGIVGAFDLTGNRDFPAEWLRAMTVAIAHRGPDDEYFHREPGLAPGTRRLAIVDLAGGRQPLANEDETVWVSFNGELFDYPELRQQLQVRGHHLATRCDTELWVHSYEDHGEVVFERARGQFGEALWDRRNRFLLLGRDSMTIHQDARLYLATLLPEQAVSHRIERGRAAWLQVLQGRVNSLRNDLSAGAGAVLTDENTVGVQATGPSEVISAEITGRRGVGPRATDPALPRSGPAPPRATDPAPPDPAPPRDLAQQCVGVAPGDGAEGPLSRDGRQGPCPRGRGFHPPQKRRSTRLEGQIMSESLPKVYVAWRDGEDDLVAAHGPDRDPADRARGSQLSTARRLGAAGDSQRGAFRQVPQRSHDHGIRPEHLDGRGVSGGPVMIPWVNNNGSFDVPATKTFGRRLTGDSGIQAMERADGLDSLAILRQER